MKREDRIILRFSIAVSIRCNTDENPLPKNPTPEQAADYIQNVLEILFAKTGQQISVHPLKYPVSSKFPLIIQLGDISECLFWFYPKMEPSQLAIHLEESLQDLFSGAVSVPA